MRAYVKKVLCRENIEKRTLRLGLIHDRLLNETEEQRAHRLGVIHDRLSNETQEQRAHRLGMIHDRLSNETQEQRAHRLGMIHDRLSNETQRQRAHRLGVIHDRLSNETEEQRAYRLSVIYDLLSNEMEEQHAHRLGVIHIRISNEMEEQRAHRIGFIHDRLFNEMEEQTAYRLGLIHDRLANQTPETRSVRLSRMQQASQACRDIANEHSFEAAIIIFADVPCAICKRSLYPQQRSNLRANMYSILLPEELVALAENSIPEQDGVASETSSQHYITLNDNKALRFNLSRGKQCTGIAAVVCAAFSVLDPNKWAKSDNDFIVIIGDKYYNDCIAARDNPAPGEVNPEYLAFQILVQDLYIIDKI
ncbi:unnamed protein product [Parnassius mnemosyne]|uniref:Uncharacterized protein n=1 Tax=Parnassius mnemosyne TaxID=213953 RepID=A0AAV1LSE2_9NEOP